MLIQRHEEMSAPVSGRERASESKRASFGSSFYIFFFPVPVLCKLGQSGVVFVLPEALSLVLRPSFVLFSWAFLFLIF